MSFPYKEPTDLTDQEWLKEDNYFSALNLIEETGDLKLEENNALDFDGDNDQVLTDLGEEVGYLFADNENTFTVEAWFKGSHGIVCGLAGGIGSSTTFAIYMENGDLKARLRGVSSGNLIKENIDTSVWNHVTVTWDGTEAKGYINGGDMSSLDVGTASVQDEYNFNIATSRPELTNYERFEGLVTNVRVWDTARTQQEIQDNMNKRLNGDETGLVGYWKLDEGTGSTAGDSAGDNDGDIEGATWVSSYSDFPPYEGEGTRISNPLALSGTAGSSNIKWSSTTPTNTAVKIYTAITESDTEEPENWTEATNDSSISGATGDLTDKYLWLKQELTTTDSEATPSLSWVEVEITFFTIKGKVTLNSTNVEGAKVRLINDTTNEYVGDTLTDENGDYEFNVISDTDDYHAMVEYENGGNKYHAVSYPFIKGGEDE